MRVSPDRTDGRRSPYARLRLLITAALGTALAGCIASPGEAPHIMNADDAEAITVVTDRGPVRGRRAAGGTVFLGLPFAAPPVGDRRFAAPQPVEAWEAPRDATALEPACIQNVPFIDKSEDCLYLNVFAPANVSPDDRLPVMVWLHGGGLVFGSNAQYGGSRLAESQNLIVVVPNYRLGALGFFAHPLLDGPGRGNYGILDQRAALQWVRHNIAAFGGDPSRVTLFGQSAGATSACTHMVSPGSIGLFDRVILQSNTCIFPDQSIAREAAEQGGIQMAEDLGCGDADDVVACLRARDADDVIDADSHRWGNGGENSWSPMIGADVLPEAPDALFARGEAAAVPLLMGSNRTEGRFFANLLTITLAWRSRASYEATVEKFMRAELVAPVLAEYDDVADASYYRATAAMFTDSRFACPMLTLHRLRADQGVSDYVYEFDDPDAPTIVPDIPFVPDQASYHSAELPYVFQHPLLLAGPEDFTPPQQALSDRIQDYWGAFAATGRPNPGGQPEWPVFDGERPLRLTPAGNGFADDFIQRHRCDFWHPLGY